MPSAATLPTAGAASVRYPRPAFRIWIALAVAVVLVGSAGALLAARAIAARQTDDARVAFRTSSAQVASTLQLAIQHEEDLIYAASGFLAENPNPTTADLARWQTAVQALRRYPELLGLGQVVIVPRAKLAAYAAGAAPNGSFRVIPAGVRPFYCFTRVVFARSGLVSTPPGYDVCAGNSTVSSIVGVDTGRADYLPVTSGASTLLAVRSPVYRGGVTPSTVAGRRAAFLAGSAPRSCRRWS